MSQYILIIGWIAIVYVLSQTLNVYRVEHVFDKKDDNSIGLVLSNHLINMMKMQNLIT